MQPSDNGQQDSGRQGVEPQQAVPVDSAQLSGAGAQYTVPSSSGEISWRSNGFADRSRSPKWYVSYSIVCVILITFAYFLFKDIVATVVLALVAAIFAFSVSRRPGEVEYVMDNGGIQVGGRRYPYAVFKCFYLASDASGSTVTLQPMKRLSPPLMLRCSVEDEERVVDALCNHLPIMERQNDIIDVISHKFHL